jgi:hypothetical protein
MKYLLLFHSKNGCTNAPQGYVTLTQRLTLIPLSAMYMTKRPAQLWGSGSVYVRHGAWGMGHGAWDMGGKNFGRARKEE